MPRSRRNKESVLESNSSTDTNINTDKSAEVDTISEESREITSTDATEDTSNTTSTTEELVTDDADHNQVSNDKDISDSNIIDESLDSNNDGNNTDDPDSLSDEEDDTDCSPHTYRLFTNFPISGVLLPIGYDEYLDMEIVKEVRLLPETTITLIAPPSDKWIKYYKSLESMGVLLVYDEES